MEHFKPLKTEILQSETEAERELEKILDDPENIFLSSIERNRVEIENVATAVEALRIAKAKIIERDRRSFSLEVPQGMEVQDISPAGVKRSIDMILSSQEEIGRGGDAFVVVSQAEEVNGVQEICYKFAIDPKTARGRNTTSEEMRLQAQFKDVIEKNNQISIGVPSPYYCVEKGNHKIIAMERLQARSVDDLLRGFGSLPLWFGEKEIDEFCDALLDALRVWHENGLYHRDLHQGNVMVSVSPERKENTSLGYVIDFGVSGKGLEGLDPYKNEVRGEVFTYSDDCGRISHFRTSLKMLKRR